MRHALPLLFALVPALAACTSQESPGVLDTPSGSTAAGGTTVSSSATAGSSGAGGQGATTSGSATTSSGGGITTLPALVDSDLVVAGTVHMPESTLVTPGVTLTFDSGTILMAAPATSLTVQGKLLVLGSAASPVSLQSEANGGPGEWAGLVLGGAGKATMGYVAIHDADVALTTKPGTGYAIDHLTIDTSNAIASLGSKGSIDRAALRGLGEAQQVDPLVITNASPHITNTLIDGSNTAVGNVQVNGAASAPVFDYVEVTGFHCAFQLNQGTNAKITHANVHDNAYGLMVIASSGTKVVASNFERNTVHIGACTGGDVTVTGTYFDAAAFDGSCGGQMNITPAGAALPDVGPKP